MLLAEKQEFKYEDLSRNYFSKLDLVNRLTRKEIKKLNDKYKELGLYIKQVRVDKNGNEKSPDDLISKNFISKKRLLKRHSKMTLEQLYYKYYCYDSFSKKDKINLRNSNISIEDYENEIYDIKNLKEQLKELHEDFNKLELKKCIIKDPEFKSKIINYIQKFNFYLKPKQYSKLYNKWREKAMLIPGINLLSIDDFTEWTIPLLKEFKAEIELTAISNILKNKLKENNSDESEEIEINNNKKKEKKGESESQSFSNDSISDSDESN